MDILKTVSIVWSMAFVLMLFPMLYELRITLRRNIALAGTLVGLLVLLACASVLNREPQFLSAYTLALLTLPSLIFFAVASGKPDGHFFFTFCFVDTMGLELILVTGLLDLWLGGGGIVLLVSRLILFPLLTWFVWKFIRRGYLELHRDVRRGWWLFALISGLYYLMLGCLSSADIYRAPTPELVIFVLALLVLIPLSFYAMLRTLFQQKQAHDADEQRINADKQMELLRIQLAAEEDYVRQARQLRHDVRHSMNVMLGYLENGDIDGARAYFAEYDRWVIDTRLPTYCENETVNAMLRITQLRCRERGIAFSARTELPHRLPYSNVETGALFGNLLENACEAAENCPQSFLNISTWCQEDRLYVEIRNSVDREVVFAEDLPASTKDNGGVGLRSVCEILEKHGGMLQMTQEGSVFLTRIIQPFAPENNL